MKAISALLPTVLKFKFEEQLRWVYLHEITWDTLTGC